MGIKKKLQKVLGTAALSMALVCSMCQIASAQDVVDTGEDNMESSLGTKRDMTEKPVAAVDEVTWDGGIVEVPVDWGSYTPEEISVSISYETEDSYLNFPAVTQTEDKISFSLWYHFDSSEEELFFSKSGKYEFGLQFKELVSGEMISTDSFKLIVPTDSNQWVIKRSTEKFDGSQDLVFYFEPGNNFFVPQGVDEINVFVSMGRSFYLTDGYVFDVRNGTLTINKDAFIKAFRNFIRLDQLSTIGEDGYYKFYYYDLPLNVFAVMNDGTCVNFDRVNYTGDYPYYETEAGWSIDISDWKLSPEEDSEEQPEKPESVFEGTTSDLISVSEESAALIGQGALEYIQQNYSEQLNGITGYTVKARLELTESRTEDVDKVVTDAFTPYLQEWKIGQYYELAVKADVIQNGTAVAGLENINVPALTKDIEVVLDIPENLDRDGRSFGMLHYQNGKAELLECVAKDGKVTFKTDSFSPYAIVYRDAVAATNTDRTENANKVTENPKTGDEMNPALFSAMAVTAVLLAAVALAVRKRNK